MRTSPIKLTWAVLLAFACATPAAAKLYKWVDAEGNVTYSERKPPDAEAEELQVRSPSVSNEEARDRLEALNDATEAQRVSRGLEQSHATASRERDERIQKNCEIARENLRILSTNARVLDKGDRGEYFLDEEQVKARTDRAQQNIDKYCD